MLLGVGWCSLLLLGRVAISLPVAPDSPNWREKSRLLNQRDTETAKFVVENWARREPEFFSELNTKGASFLLGYDLQQKQEKNSSSEVVWGADIVPSLTKAEWDLIKPETCVVFIKSLELVPHLSVVPEACQKEFLEKGKVTVPGASRLPSEWIEQASGTFIRRLTADHLNNLAPEAFSALIQANKCDQLDPDALNGLELSYWLKMTPECLAQASYLPKLRMSPELLNKLSDNIFSAYNGALDKETISAMIPGQAGMFASLVPEPQPICMEFDIWRLSDQAISAITPRCLHGFLLHHPSAKIGGLKERWDLLAAVFESFTEQMVPSILEINFPEFGKLPRRIIDKVFNSKAAVMLLPKDPWYTVRAAYHAKLYPEHYKFAVDNSGEAAAILLEHAKYLYDDTFVLFEAADYAKLKSRENETFGVDGYFWESLLRRPNFNKMVQNFSRDAKSHYCSTLEDFEQYRTKLWLRENITDHCQKSLLFKIDAALMARAPELEKGDQSWEEFVNSKGRNYWLSASPQALEDLMQMPSFCAAVAALFADDNFLAKQPESVLKVVDGKCAAHLYKQITPEITPKLAKTAFKLFTNEMFLPRLKLTDLTLEQLSHLSDSSEVNVGSKVLAHLASDDILSLDEARLKALSSSLYYHVHSKELKPKFVGYLTAKACEEKSWSLLQSVFDKCEELLAENNENRWDSVDAINNNLNAKDELMEGYVKVNLYLNPRLRIALSQEITELRFSIIKKDFLYDPEVFYARRAPVNGFDNAWFFDSLRSWAAAFVHPQMQVAIIGEDPCFIYQNIWIEQMLNFIQDTVLSPADEARPALYRFNWVVGEDAGYLVGLLLGKAIQKGEKPPFELGESFWVLLMNPGDAAIDAYYKKTYQKDWEEYCEKILQQMMDGTPGEHTLRLVRPEALAFSTVDAKSNLYAPSEDQVIPDEISKHYTLENIKAKYLDPLDAAIRAGFRSAVRGFLAGLGMTVYTEYFQSVKSPQLLTALFASYALTSGHLRFSILWHDLTDTNGN